MDDDVIESGNNLEVAGQEETVESTVENTESIESENEETEEVEVVEDESDDVEESDGVQSKEDNKYARLARKQAEEKAKKDIEKATKEAYERGLAQGKIQTYIGKQNPYTGTTIKDDYDVQEYLDMFELDSKGEDPISGYREQQKEKARKEAEESLKKEEESQKRQWYENDTNDFVNKYSAEKLQELTKDKDFELFADGKLGNRPLAEIYESYQKLIGKYSKKSVETAKQIVANNINTPGGIHDGDAKELDWNNMSDDQFEKYIRKAKDGELR